MDIRLIAADLDGTLLDRRKCVSERNFNALRKADEKGILFVPATGRIWRALPQGLLDLPFLRYVITANGAVVVDCVLDEKLYRAEIPVDDAIEICDYLSQVGTFFDCYMDGKGYTEQYYYERIENFCMPEFWELVRRTRQPVPNLAEHVRACGPVEKFQLYFADAALRERVMAQVKEKYSHMAISTAMSNNIEINAAEGNKGSALRVLCGLLGIDMSQVVAFGDGTNDVTMLQTVGVGVAMANACDEAKAAAKYVTLTNDEDGVADFLEKYVL